MDKIYTAIFDLDNEPCSIWVKGNEMVSASGGLKEDDVWLGEYPFEVDFYEYIVEPLDWTGFSSIKLVREFKAE